MKMKFVAPIAAGLTAAALLLSPLAADAATTTTTQASQNYSWKVNVGGTTYYELATTSSTGLVLLLNPTPTIHARPTHEFLGTIAVEKKAVSYLSHHRKFASMSALFKKYAGLHLTKQY